MPTWCVAEEVGGREGEGERAENICTQCGCSHVHALLHVHVWRALKLRFQPHPTPLSSPPLLSIMLTHTPLLTLLWWVPITACLWVLYLLLNFYYLLFCTTHSLAVLYPVTLNVTSISFNAVQLSWSPPSAINVDYFYVLFAISALLSGSTLLNTSLSSVLCFPGSHLSATINGLEQGQTYSFAIQYSVSGYDRKSFLSNSVKAKTLSSKCMCVCI